MLRIRTSYSFRNAVGDLDQVLKVIQDKGYPYAPITDRASTYGWVKWQKLLQEKAPNLPILLGVELAISPDPTDKRPAFDYWTFFSKEEDLRPLTKLVKLATSQFRYQPLLNYQQAIEAKGAIKIIGQRTLIRHLPEVDSDTYCFLSPGIVPGYFKQVEKRKIPWILGSNNYYPTKEERALYQVVCGRLASDQTYPQWILSKEELLNWLARNLGEFSYYDVLENTQRVAAMAQRAQPDKAKLPKPRTGAHVPAPNTHLLSYCFEGAKKRGMFPLPEGYRDRLEKELKLIQAKNFVDYFFIVADVVRWAKERMIVGPARGSSCGSLVCYLLGITDIDPIPHGLIFERFIDINRGDLPDIDIDFSDQHREEVIEYLRETYGQDHVSRLGTVNLYRPRSALHEAAKAMKIDMWKLNATLDSMIQRSSADARALDTLEDTLKDLPAGKELLENHPEIQIACDMEGQPRHCGQHASAVVLNDQSLELLAPVDQRTKSLMMDKKDAETVGLLKIDCLGLTQLSVLEDALELAKLPRGHLQDLDKMENLGDPLAFEPLQKLQFTGIFQFQGIALKSLAQQFKMSEFNDIVMITALARPGPLISGNANEWIKRRRGDKPIVYPHPLFEPYLKDTLGIVVYQEQVMQIGRQIGDLSWADVTALRKAMSKSLGVEYFAQFGDRWKEGARKKGIPDEVLNKMWDDLCAYGYLGKKVEGFLLMGSYLSSLEKSKMFLTL